MSEASRHPLAEVRHQLSRGVALGGVVGALATPALFEQPAQAHDSAAQPPPPTEVAPQPPEGYPYHGSENAKLTPSFRLK